MAIVDVTVVPIGAGTTSVSQYVADIQKILMDYKEKNMIDYKLQPMSTIIEGELSVLFEVIQAIHESPFQKDIKRVTTNIRIDDRRDKKVSMYDKVKSVESKLK